MVSVPQPFSPFAVPIVAGVFPIASPSTPFTPLIFVLAATAIVGNAIYAAFADMHQFSYLLVSVVLLLLGLPGYFFWSRRRP